MRGGTACPTSPGRNALPSRLSSAKALGPPGTRLRQRIRAGRGTCPFSADALPGGTFEPNRDASRPSDVHRTPQPRGAPSRTCSLPEAAAVCGSRFCTAVSLWPGHSSFSPAPARSCPPRCGTHARLAPLSCESPVSVSTQPTGNNTGRAGPVREPTVMGRLRRIAHGSRSCCCQRLADAAGDAPDMASRHEFPLRRPDARVDVPGTGFPAWDFRQVCVLPPRPSNMDVRLRPGSPRRCTDQPAPSLEGLR